MKPRTKEQIKLAEVVEKLKPLTNSQVDYINRHAFPLLFAEARNTLYCPNCGNKWKLDNAENVNNTQCPHCRKFGYVKHHTTKLSQEDYVVFSKRVNEYQMLRYFNVFKYSSYKEGVRYWHREVAVAFVDSNGKTTVFTKDLAPFCYYRIKWCATSLKLKRCVNKHNVVYSLGTAFVKTYSMLPILKRNGWNGKDLGRFSLEHVENLLKRPEIESYYKSGHLGIVLDYLKTDSLPVNTRRYAKLASRHQYVFDTVEKWRDFMDYISDLKYLGKDIFNPSIIFPENFQAAHQQTQLKVEAKKAVERAERQRREDFERLQRDKEKAEWIDKYVNMFSTMKLDKGGLVISALITPEDFQHEADHMHHCIRSYYGKLDTLLLSITKSGEKQETAEIDLKKAEIVQCRGVNNKPSQYHDEIMEFIKESMNTFIKLYRNVLKAEKEKDVKQELVAVA